ncbi:PTS system mannose/fructose/sorbose family transporter subunit IID [Macrococcoides canis]|uniref:PTS system mannose-specific EIID component n=2 Tax=Macrococcoides canis TaxID=1855823 RepID=A0A509GMN1_9STAP|nr:PTS system mannose/fructose/sorbose family transporter subunit IID [Macrococcus canis]QAX90278.1 PTS system mannose-specific EIID component [Macrococcus canis]
MMTKSDNLNSSLSKKLTDKDIRRVSLRYMFGGQLGWNYERMMSLSYARAIYPALDKIYDDKEELREIMKTELQFFNTSPFLTAFIIGMDLAIQEEREENTKEAVAAIKTSMMGPFAAIGDSLFGAVLPTIFGSLAAYMGLEGNPLGVILWLIMAFVILGLRYFELPIAYKEGKKLVSSMSGLLQDVTESATLLGVFVIGGLIPTVVKVMVPFKFTIGEKSIELQKGMLDQIMPAIVPIVLVSIAYWLLGKKYMNSTRVIWIFLILSILFYSFRILAVAS